MKKKIPLALLAITIVIVSVFIFSSKEYVAVYGTTCGPVTYSIGGKGVATNGFGPFGELNFQVIETKTFLKGFYTGRVFESSECGEVPEFFVLSYRPAEPIFRCTSYGDAYTDEMIHLYPQNASVDEFLEIDRVVNKNVKTAELKTCREMQGINFKCQEKEHPAFLCDRTAGFCCPNLRNSYGQEKG